MTRALTDDLNSGSIFSCSFMMRARNSCDVANLWALHACSTMQISRDDAPAHEWRAAAREWRSPPRPERIAFTRCRSVRAESTHAEPQGNGAGLLHAVTARLEASDYTVPQDDPLEVLWGELIGTRLLTSRACASDGLTRLAFGFTWEFAQRAANIARTTFLTSIRSTPSRHRLGFC